MLAYEREQWDRGFQRVAGVDEAGRGPLAGPVVAAAVVMTREFAAHEEHGILRGLTDSKALSAAARERFHKILTTTTGVEIGVGVVDNLQIDRINILRATVAAMALAIDQLPRPPEVCLVDGRPAKGFPGESRFIVRGDALSLCIAAASVIAKVVRDRMMLEFDSAYPAYGFKQHKGYGTAAHLEALAKHGPCPIHRISFRPVRECGVRSVVTEAHDSPGHTVGA